MLVRSNSVAGNRCSSCQSCGTTRCPGGLDNTKCTRVGGASMWGFFTGPQNLDEVCCNCAERNGWISERCSGCIRTQSAAQEISSAGTLWNSLLDKAGDLTSKHLTKAAEAAAKRERERRVRAGETGIGVGFLSFAEDVARNLREYQERKETSVRRKCQECYDEFDPSKGIFCARRQQHFFCQPCFSREVHEQLSQAAQIQFAARGGKVICPLCLPNTTEYTEGALARVLSDPDFARYLHARSEAIAKPAAQRQQPKVSGDPRDPNGRVEPDGKECQICFSDVSDGVQCPGPARHVVCRDCFSRDVSEQYSPEMQGRFSAAGARAVCRLCLPAAVIYSDGALARALSDADFALYRQAVVEAGAAQVRREEEARLQQVVAALRAELAADGGGGGGGRGERVRRHRLRIAEEVLCLRCPRCGQAFVDFDGCFALACGRCACAFCAYCLADCGVDAHPHVAACALNTAQGRNLHGDAAMFRRAQNARRTRALREYLRDNVDPADRSAVRAAIDADLVDLGME